jgi:hypothetical protein
MTLTRHSSFFSLNRFARYLGDSFEIIPERTQLTAGKSLQSSDESRLSCVRRFANQCPSRRSERDRNASGVAAPRTATNQIACDESADDHRDGALMRERIVREIVDRLVGTFSERLQHIQLSAAYSELLLDRASGDAQALNDRANRIDYSDYVTPWSAIGAS